MKFNVNAYYGTFITSNSAPHNYEFNFGIWNRLQQNVRWWTQKQGGVFVVTGRFLEPSQKAIGREQVAVPKQFHKIVL